MSDTETGSTRERITGGDKGLMKTLAIAAMALILILATATTASAETLENQQIDEDEAFQFDNYVVEVTKSYDFDSNNKTKQYVELTLYKIGSDGELDEIKNSDDQNGRWILKYGDGHQTEVTSITISDEVSEGEITFEYVDASSTMAELNIDTDWDIQYTDGLQEASDAVFIGQPNLDVTKSVSPAQVDVGGTVTVTIEAKNVGSVTATEIDITNPQDEGFVLDTYIVDTSMTPSLIGSNETKTLLKYTLQAVTPGTKTLSSADVTYGREADSESYETNSTRPMVLIAASEATMTSSFDADPEEMSTGETVTLNVRLKETSGKSPASEVVVQIDAPSGAEFQGLVDEEDPDDGGPTIETISGNDLQVELPMPIEAGKERELIMEYSIAEPGEYEFTGEASYDTGSQLAGKQFSQFEEVEVQVTETISYQAAHQPIYVYATPVVAVILVIGWVMYRRQQYKF